MHAADGFVAIRDINLIAETHPRPPCAARRHVQGRRRSRTGGRAGCCASADIMAAAGLTTAAPVNVGPGGGAAIFHLHWHVLGGRFDTGKLARVLELETA